MTEAVRNFELCGSPGMNAEPKDTRDKCANCCALFEDTSSGGDGGKNLEHYFRTQTKILAFALKMNGKEETVQVVDALTKVYRLDWFLKIRENQETSRNELNLCLECFMIFSQLYKLFSEFQLLRKAESILSERLETISSVVEMLLTNSSGKDLDHSTLQCDSLTDWQGHSYDGAERETETGTLPETSEVSINVVKDELVDDVEPESSIPVVISAVSLLDHGSNAVRDDLVLNEEAVLDPAEMDETSPDVADGVSEQILGFDSDAHSTENPTVEDAVQRKAFPAPDSNSQTTVQMTTILNATIIHECPECSETFLNVDELQQHALMHLQQATTECRVCRQSFKNVVDHHYHCPKCRGGQLYLYLSDMVDSQVMTKLTDFESGVASAETDVRAVTKRTSLSKKTSKSKKSRSKPSLPAAPSNGLKALPNIKSLTHHLRRRFEGNTDSSYFSSGIHSDPPVTNALQPHGPVPSSSFSSHSNSSQSSSLERAYPCRLCTQTFSSTVELAQHLTSAHIIDFSFQCTLCPSRFDTLEEWRAHAASYSEHQCHVCRKTFTDRTNLKQHQRRHRKQKPGGAYQSNPYVCKICKISFPFVEDLRRHSEAHSARTRDDADSGNEFVCKICNRSFSNIRSFNLHSRIHSESNSHPFNAEHCADNFRTTRALKRRQNVRTKDSLQLNLPGNLGGEMARTSLDTEQPSQSSSLNILSRNAEREEGFPGPTPPPPPPEVTSLAFKCTDCEDDFHSAMTLGVHRASVHQAADLYKCHICWQSFPYSNELRIHMTEHVNGSAQHDDVNTVGPGILVKVELSEGVETKVELEEPDVIMLD